jgi:hypothetical protein
MSTVEKLKVETKEGDRVGLIIMRYIYLVIIQELIN